MSCAYDVAVLASVAVERGRQVEKWGVQHHPDGTGSADQKNSAILARDACDEAHSIGIGTWADILSEEFHEAMAESDPAKLREELIQLAAVAVAWVEDIESRPTAEDIDAMDPHKDPLPGGMH